MKKVNIFLLIITLGMNLFTNSFAQNDENDRKGFFIGFGLGSGLNMLIADGDHDSNGAFTYDIKIGGGFNDRILLLVNPSNVMVWVSGVEFTTYNLPIAVQLFLTENYYIRPGVGFSWFSASNESITFEGSVSFGADFATGYEFRIGNSFAISPEFNLHYSYNRLFGETSNSFTPGASASLIWYF